MSGVLGLTRWPTKTIVLNSMAPPEVQRSTLVHECIHVERGPAPNQPTLIAREELAVEKATARRLIDIHQLCEALAESTDARHVADLLEVDTALVRVRMAHLHPSERAYLRRRLECGIDCGDCPHHTCRKEPK